MSCPKMNISYWKAKHVYIKGQMLKYTRERKAFKSDIDWNVNIRQ